MAVTLKPGEYIATCRVCGKKGIEDASDPAPGLCPMCFAHKLHSDFTYALRVNTGMTENEAENALNKVSRRRMTMATIKTISVTYDRKQNLGDFSSANIGITIWADVEPDEDLDATMDNLWRMAKANVKSQLLPIVQPKAEKQTTFLGLPVIEQGEANADQGINGQISSVPANR